MFVLASQALSPLLAAASSSGVMKGPLGIIIFIIFAVIVVAVIIFRRRKGGPGPQVNWVPKPLRGKVNEHYEEEGWQKPFDEDGRRNPERDEI